MKSSTTTLKYVINVSMFVVLLYKSWMFVHRNRTGYAWYELVTIIYHLHWRWRWRLLNDIERKRWICCVKRQQNKVVQSRGNCYGRVVIKRSSIATYIYTIDTKKGVKLIARCRKLKMETIRNSYKAHKRLIDNIRTMLEMSWFEVSQIEQITRIKQTVTEASSLLACK